MSTYVHTDTNTLSTILDTFEHGYLITQEWRGGKRDGERVVRGFVYSADLACQRFWELTGVELTVEEVVNG